jgi:diguanylate cyclase (GGDEF)-like protein
VNRVGEVSRHVLHARRAAAAAPALLGLCGVVVVLRDRSLVAQPLFAFVGFGIILVTAALQLLAPRSDWLKIQESLAPAANVLIVGLGGQQVTVLSVVWLAAVATGVLARGGRLHWIGGVLLLGSLALPIVREQRLGIDYAGLCAATIALLVTCGRLTRELRELLDGARHDAEHDGLTGALSRVAFRVTLERIAADSEASGVAALLLIDLDNFGQVNKSQGHAAGDALLASVVSQVRDTIGPEGVVGRLGGDEFAAIVSGPQPALIARTLLDNFERPDFGGHAVGSSVGVARVPRDGRDAETLLRAGDVALRVAKRSGKQQVSFYGGEPLADEGPKGARGALARLTAGDGVEMFVQPIVEIRSGQVHAFEALARFHTRGTSSPLHWFSLADEFGLRDELELACLHAALRLLPERPADSRLSVNLSGPLLVDPRTQALLDAQPTLAGLILEVTENSLLGDTAGLHAAITKLLSREVRFAVDDMGAGYSGLRQLTILRPTYLKLDRALIKDIDADPDRAALITALLSYARQTGGYLVAECVETPTELAALAHLGVPLVQGYYLGPPAAAWPAEPPVIPQALTRPRSTTSRPTAVT